MFVDPLSLALASGMYLDGDHARALARWAASPNLTRVASVQPGDEVVDEKGQSWVCAGPQFFQKLHRGCAIRGSLTPFASRRWVVRYPAAKMY